MVGQDFWVYGMQGDFKLSSGLCQNWAFYGYEVYLVFQILVFCMNLRGNFGFNGFSLSGILVYHYPPMADPGYSMNKKSRHKNNGFTASHCLGLAFLSFEVNLIAAMLMFQI